MIGTSLGHYRIVDQIGAGGMGVVYRAHDERLNRDVAIKVLPKEVAVDPGRLARFENEAQAVAKLDHPNILAIHELGTHEGTPFIVTELLEGESLRQRMPPSGMGWQKAVEIGAAVADGLAAAHSKGIVHRDLKPENIFVTSDSRVKILDFGLAQVKDKVEDEAETATLTPAGTAEGTVMGTVGYMSPEQVRGQPADARSDIFALGCVLYEMLSGRRAFSGETGADTQAAILKDEPPTLAGSDVVLPSTLDGAVRRCLEKRPEARFQSAADLAYNLRSITAADVVPMVSAADVGRDQIRSIALLPLQNLTGDPEQLYFVDGLHEELIATFAQISAFDKVIARTSVMGFRDSATPIRAIGEQLGVDAVLEGSVRQSGDTVRATLQLIDARSESHLWADSFERDFTNILALQSEVARAVADQVKLTLTEEEEQRLKEKRTVNEEAYRAYLRGVRLSRWGETGDNLEQARVLFSKAIDLDPEFADAHFGLSCTLYQIGRFYRPPHKYLPEAQDEAVKAIELDAHLAEAYAVIGSIKLLWHWDWKGAGDDLRRAFELNPSIYMASQEYAYYWIAVGQPENAIRVTRNALELDPLNVRLMGGLSFIYCLSRRFGEGIRQAQSALELQPNDRMANWDLTVNLVGAGRHQEAADVMERLLGNVPPLRRNGLWLAALLGAQAAAGMRSEAVENLAELEELRRTSHVAPSSMALAYILMGDRDRAVGFLERAVDEKDTQLFFIVVSFFVDPLRGDPAFDDVLGKMNLPMR